MFIDAIQNYNFIPLAMKAEIETVQEMDRPLRDCSGFVSCDLDSIPFDFQSTRWLFEDGEPDDFAAIYAMPRGRTWLIAEPHERRGEVLARTKILLERLGDDPARALNGSADPATIDFLIEQLRGMDDHSLCIQIIAPSPTLTAIIEREPDLLAQKAKRIVNYAGFAYRDCVQGKFAGQKIYYTTVNYNVDLKAAQALFNFAQKHKAPLYIVAGDNLRLPHHIRFDLPKKFKGINTSAARYMTSEIAAWNQVILKGKLLSEAEKQAVIAGYRAEDIWTGEMTPADAIAEVVDLSFDQLEIISRGFSNIQITDEPRFEDGEPKRARAVLLEEDPDSTIRYVDGFYLKETSLDTAGTFQFLLNRLIDIQWNEQLKGSPASAAREFFRLRIEVQEAARMDYSSRLTLFNDLNELHRKLNRRLTDIAEGRAEFAQLSDVERRELYAFAAQGRGAESVRIFAKEPIVLDIDDPDYGAKIMEAAHHLDNFIEERLAEQFFVEEEAVRSLDSVSQKLSALFPDHDAARIFLRGMIGSGKSTLLSNFLGIDEAEVFSSDDVKMRLGGDLAHHESVAFRDKLSNLDWAHTIDVKTNIREFNNAMILSPKEGVAHIILDIWIDKAVVEERLSGRAERGGRLPTAAEIEEGYSQAMKNRAPIVQAALESSRFEWRLFDNSYSQMIEIATIQNQVLTVKDPARLSEILIKDDRLADILLPVLGRL